MTDTSTSSTSTTTSTTTATFSAASSTTSVPCDDFNGNGICDVYDNLRCEVAVLTGSSLTIAKIVLLLAAIWVVMWCIGTIIVNILHKNNGHHRWIHLLEELGIIVLWIFMGVLNLTMRNNGVCKIISIVIHYFAVMIAGCFVFEAIFANSMVHNKRKKDGIIPPFFNYLVPILLALIPCLVTYFTNSRYYGVSGLHCFVISELPIMYAFVIPVWGLIIVSSWPSSLGNLSCDVTSPDQDHLQCYWAKFEYSLSFKLEVRVLRKSCKVLNLLSFWFFSVYLTCIFGSSSQRLWSLIFGPLLFIAHTFCHINTSSKWYRPSLPGALYTPCFAPRPFPFVPTLNMPKHPPSPVKREETPREPIEEVFSQPPPPYDSTFDLPDYKPKKKASYFVEGDHMVASDLWGWASTKGDADRRDEIFGIRPY